jgi:hypothetical protein
MMNTSHFAWIGLMIAVGGCVREPQWVSSIKNDDYEIVKVGHYPHATLQIRYGPDEFGDLRGKIEESSGLFAEVVHHFYPDEANEMDFRYKYAAIHNEQTVLRYFARVPESDMYAGYSLQFVIVNETVEEIYLFKTPLE